MQCYLNNPFQKAHTLYAKISIVANDTFTSRPGQSLTHATLKTKHYISESQIICLGAICAKHTHLEFSYITDRDLNAPIPKYQVDNNFSALECVKQIQKLSGHVFNRTSLRKGDNCLLTGYQPYILQNFPKSA